MEELFSRCLLFHPAAVSKGSSRGETNYPPCEGFGQRGSHPVGGFLRRRATVGLLQHFARVDAQA